MQRILLSALALLFSISATAQETHYISDELYTYLHSGPSNQYKILGSVTAGSPVELIQHNPETGYSEIIDNKQRQGWVISKFVTQTPGLKSQVSLLDEENKRLKAELTQADQLIRDLESNPEFENKISELTAKLTQAENQVAALSSENEMLKATSGAEAESIKMQWLLHGAGVIIGGIIIGLILANLPKRRRRGDILM